MIQSLPDIVGASTPVQIAASSKIAPQWVKFFVTGAGVVRVGGSEASATRGYPVTATLPLDLPYKGSYPAINPYPLSGIYAYVPTGSTLSVLYDA